MHPKTRRLVCSAFLALWIGPALAADTTPAATPSDSLGEARTLIAARNWSGAVQALRRVNEPRSADWNNLLGYSLRKMSPPDLDSAERHYTDALRIDPQHRGALEYSGELYLMKGDLARAEQRLTALDKACFLPCEEFTDLKKAVQAYKANGNRYVTGR